MKLDEQELTKVLGDAVGQVQPDTHALVAGAVRSGRRLRARRRMVAAGSVAAVIAGASLYGAGLGPQGEDRYPLPAASGNRSAAKAAIPDFVDPAAQPPGTVAMTGQGTVYLLRDLLPGTPATSDYEGQADPVPAGLPPETYGGLQLTGDEGESEVIVNVQPFFGPSMAKTEVGTEVTSEGERRTHPAGIDHMWDCTTRAPADLIVQCDARNLADGSALIVYEVRDDRLITRHADLLKPDGTRIVVGAANGRDIENGPVTGDRPPLSLDDLTAIVTSGRWQHWVDPSLVTAAEAQVRPYKDFSAGVGLPPQR